MARIPISYWEKRQTELMKRIENSTNKTINGLIEAYDQATKNINAEIVRIFKNYGEDKGLSKETLLNLLSKKETDTHYKNLLTVINNNIKDEDLKKKLLAKYEAPAYSYRISRYQALQENIDLELKKLADAEQKITEIRYTDTLKEGYYHTIFDLQQGTGFAFDFSKLSTEKINMLLKENWTNSANFSKRIWNNSEKLGNYLKTQLTASEMSGKSIQKISSELSDYMNVGLYNATTLVRTEVNHFANEAEAVSYQELGIEQYQFIATLDNITCKHCAELDNRIFNLKDKKVGKNFPPMHPNDRCTTVAVLDNKVTDDLKRRAKNENGENMSVSQNTSYKEWAKEYAPQQYKDYYINSKLPKKAQSEDTYLPTQIGFYDENKELKFIPKNVIITNVYTIAGNGTNTTFRSAEKYVAQYGGKPDEWMKKVGKIETDKYICDIHWVEHSKYGQMEFKMKGKKLK